MKETLISLLCCCILFMVCSLSAAEEAPELQPARLLSVISQDDLPNLFDRSYTSIWYARRGWIQVDLQPDQTAYGLYICFHTNVTPVVIQIRNNQGYQDYATVSGEYLHQYVSLPGTSSVRIRIADESKKEMLQLAELHLFGSGEKPEWIQEWHTASKADMLLLCGHPDDVLLWFGGALPTYAGERGMHVQVVYLARGDSWRHNELLDGLWMCGVRDYPIVSPFHDVRTENRSIVYGAWGGTKVFYPWFVSVVRRLRPEVLITQDFNGEYGHAIHQVAAYTAVNCPPLAADPEFDPPSAALYGAWQIKKVYIHLYKQNQIVMDWEQPLTFFNGRTGLEIANAALECHKSQQPIGYSAKASGRYDCRLFGLYATTVGPDINRNDFFENIN